MNTEIKQAGVTLTRIKDAYGILVYIDFFREMVRQYEKQAVRRIAALYDCPDIADIILKAFNWKASKKGYSYWQNVARHGTDVPKEPAYPTCMRHGRTKKMR